MARKNVKEDIGSSYNGKFASRLREIMENGINGKGGFTQEEIAEVMGVKRQAVSQYCNGVTVPTIDKLEKLADYLKVTTDYLLGRTDIKSKELEIKEMCEITGLTENAIEMLRARILEDAEFTAPIVNLLLEDAYHRSIQEEYTESLLESLYNYFIVDYSEDEALEITMSGQLWDVNTAPKTGDWRNLMTVKGVSRNKLVEAALMGDVQTKMRELRKSKEAKGR